MDWLDAADRLHLNNYLLLDEQVETKAQVETDSVERNRDWSFSLNAQVVLPKNVSQARLVHALQQARTEARMNHHSGSNDFAGDGIDLHSGNIELGVT